jgi:glycogen synthase
MRILFLTNFYLPTRPGGYTQWCQEVACELRNRGHTVGILTSRHELDQIKDVEKDVFRVLFLDGELEYYKPHKFFTQWSKQQKENRTNFLTVLEEFSPDILFVWGMWSMSHEIPALGEKYLRGRVVYYISDYWPTSVDMHSVYWNSPTKHWYMRLPKRILGSIAKYMILRNGQPSLKFENTICVSNAVRETLIEAGIPLQNAKIIYGGSDPNRFPVSLHREFSLRPLKLLYAGQIVPNKGVHTALEAMAILDKSYCFDGATLTLVGSGHPEYEASLQEFVNRKGLQDKVHFLGFVDKNQMPELLGRSDVLIFPSIYEEPFARMVQEAMLSGMVVVGTTTGGTKDILQNEMNGLTFEKEDASGLASQINKLASDADLCRRLAEAGRQTVLNNFTFDKMVDEIEDYLHSVVGLRSLLPFNFYEDHQLSKSG